MENLTFSIEGAIIEHARQAKHGVNLQEHVGENKPLSLAFSMFIEIIVLGKLLVM